MTHRLEILADASAAINGDRDLQYGAPSDNMSTTAELWTAMLRRAGKLAEGASITPRDVALCMVQVKLAREAHKHKDDNCVDGVGYLAIAAELSESITPTTLIALHPGPAPRFDHEGRESGVIVVPRYPDPEDSNFSPI